MEMMNQQFKNFIAKEMNSNGVTWMPDWVDMILKAILEGTAEYLSNVKGNIPQAIEVQDDNKKPIFAIMVEKVENEEVGGYTLTYAFIDNDNELPSDTNITSIYNPIVQSTVNEIAFRSYGFRFAPVKKDNDDSKGYSFLGKISSIIFNAIKKYMISDIKNNKSLELIDFITIDAEEVGDKVVLKVTPSEKLKQHIKDDVDVSVA